MKRAEGKQNNDTDYTDEGHGLHGKTVERTPPLRHENQTHTEFASATGLPQAANTVDGRRVEMPAFCRA